jgi:hypothetical protein
LLRVIWPEFTPQSGAVISPPGVGRHLLLRNVIDCHCLFCN